MRSLSTESSSSQRESIWFRRETASPIVRSKKVRASSMFFLCADSVMYLSCTTLNWQQADGLVTALPLGLRRIDALRTLTTEALAVLMPFKAQEIWDRGGV